MEYIECMVFKSSGKYYTDEYVPCPDGMMADYQIPEEVRANRSIPSMFYVGKTIEHEIPFLILPEEK